MRKLITANFHRFSKDRFSWCVLGIVVILSLGNVFNSVGSFETRSLTKDKKPSVLAQLKKFKEMVAAIPRKVREKKQERDL